MRRLIWMVAAAALALPAIALAAGSSPRSAAEKQCRTELHSMGAAMFKATYGTNKNGSNAFGKCVSHRTAQDNSDQSSSKTSAEQQCRTERSADPAAFKAKYGTNKNQSNAFGKCVSETARTMASKAEATQVSDEINAAKQCRTERSADPAAFKAKYATNKNQSNAFGKCVSETARAKERKQQGSSSS
jgi:hypothetical protein